MKISDFQSQCKDMMKMSDVELRAEYEKISDALETPAEDISLHEWIVFTTCAANSTKNALRVVHDAYKLGYMAGRGNAMTRQEMEWEILSSELVTKKLLELGVPISHEGFYFLREAILEFVRETPICISLQSIFNEIAEEYGGYAGDGYHVRHRIETAIDCVISSNSSFFLREYFGEPKKQEEGQKSAL